MDIFPDCRVTEHALLRTKNHTQVLESNGISADIIFKILHDVCMNPKSSHKIQADGTNIKCYRVD